MNVGPAPSGMKPVAYGPAMGVGTYINHYGPMHDLSVLCSKAKSFFRTRFWMSASPADISQLHLSAPVKPIVAPQILPPALVEPIIGSAEIVERKIERPIVIVTDEKRQGQDRRYGDAGLLYLYLANVLAAIVRRTFDWDKHSLWELARLAHSWAFVLHARLSASAQAVFAVDQAIMVRHHSSTLSCAGAFRSQS